MLTPLRYKTIFARQVLEENVYIHTPRKQTAENTDNTTLKKGNIRPNYQFWGSSL